MAYDSTIWRTGDVVTAGKLNNAEDGIEQNANNITTLNENLGQVGDDITGLQSDVAGLQTAIGSLQTDIANLETLVVNCGIISSLPATVENSAIEGDMVVLQSTLGTPSAQTSSWTVTTSTGSLTISGTIEGSTTLTLYLTKSR